MSRRILALAAVAVLLPFAALADDIGAGEDIVVEPERQESVTKETMVEKEKAVSLPPPGWRAPTSDKDSDSKR